MRWTLDEMFENRKKAERLAHKWLRLKPRFLQVAPYYRFGDDSLTIELNPTFVSVSYVPTSTCPRWLREYVKDSQQNAHGDDDTVADRKLTEFYAYGHVVAAILRRWGYDGYIQDELPF